MSVAPMASLDDIALVELVGEGDQPALGELYSRYSPMVFSFVLARLDDREVAEEVAADVWLGCWRSARAFRGDSQVLTWLLGIAKSQIGAHTRRKYHPEVPLDEAHQEVLADDADPAGLVVSADQAGVLLDALRSLPPDLTEVVRMAWVYEVPYGQISDVLGIPVGTVKSRISRARGLLREQLRGSDD